MSAIRPLRRDDLTDLRRLIPGRFRPRRARVAVLEGAEGALLAAAVSLHREGVAWLHLGIDRHQEPVGGRALVRWAVDQATTAKLRCVLPVGQIVDGGPRSVWLEKEGFQRLSTVRRYESDIDRLLARVEPLTDRLREERPEVAARYHVVPVAELGRTDEIDELVASAIGGSPGLYSHTRSCVLLEGDRIAGACLSRGRDVPVVTAFVVSEEDRLGTATAWLRAYGLRWLRDRGLERVRYAAREGDHAHAIHMGRRAGAEELPSVSTWGKDLTGEGLRLDLGASALEEA